MRDPRWFVWFVGIGATPSWYVKQLGTTASLSRPAVVSHKAAPCLPSSSILWWMRLFGSGWFNFDRTGTTTMR